MKEQRSRKWQGGFCGRHPAGAAAPGAGHCEERKTHFCTFIAQHLLCTDILRPASFLQPPKPPLILDPNSHIKSDGGVGYTVGQGGRDRGDSSAGMRAWGACL